MRNMLRLGLAGLVAALALATMVASASANRLSSSSQHFRIIWTSLIFENTTRTARILCPVTLEGSFHSATIVKTVGSLIGFITRASIKGEEPPCTGGTATILSESLPWHITYEGFRGTLPRLEGVILLLVGPAFQLHPRGSVTCLARSEGRHPLEGIANVETATGGAITTLTPETRRTVPLTGEGGLCSFGGEGDFKGEESGRVTNDTGGTITVTLI